MRKIRRAIIPAAGRGTRLLPATAAVAKELLPVGLKPMIQHCIEEAIGAGIEEIAVVLSPGKESIGRFLSVAARSERPELARFGALLRGCRLEFPVQPEPRGVADALRRARDFTGGEPFAVLLPDNISFASPPPLAQMLPHLEEGLSGLALTLYRPETAAWFANCGRVDRAPGAGPAYRIRRLHDKGEGPFRLRNGAPELVGYARYVLQPDFFASIPDPPAAPEGELDETPILQGIVAADRMIGVHLQGEFFDAGNPAGFAAANRFAAGDTGSGTGAGPVAFDPASR